MNKQKQQKEITPELDQKIKKTVQIKDQYPDEKVILFLHRHAIVFVGHIVVVLVLLLIPMVAFLIGPEIVPFLFDIPYSNILLLVVVIYLMFVWLYFFTAWVDYYLDAWVVTNRRIINIEQKGLFRRVISVQSLGNVQDTTSEIYGPMRTFMNFGNVEVQTAGEAPRFMFEDVPDPEHIKEVITKASQDYKQKYRHESDISNV